MAKCPPVSNCLQSENTLYSATVSLNNRHYKYMALAT